jgi:hypothetical protein
MDTNKPKTGRYDLCKPIRIAAQKTAFKTYIGYEGNVLVGFPTDICRSL